MSSTYGYSPRILPFAPDSQTGFSQNLTLTQVASQNLINIVLCAPGERIMYPDFGVGLRNYLFEMNDSYTKSNIKAAIEGQVAIYLPYINIVDINFGDEQEDDADHGVLKINLLYQITATEICDHDSLSGLGFVFGTGGGGITIVEYIDDGGIMVVPGVGPTVYKQLGADQCSPLTLNPAPLAVTWEEEAYDEAVSDSVESTLVFEGEVVPELSPYF